MSSLEKVFWKAKNDEIRERRETRPTPLHVTHSGIARNRHWGDYGQEPKAATARLSPFVTAPPEFHREVEFRQHLERGLIDGNTGNLILHLKNRAEVNPRVELRVLR